jgi:UDP-2-acetamido-3-amino-2,3-dideoxy-glucuronate N-acetyltransferase
MVMDAEGPRVAVIGCGEWGMNHIRVWHELGRLSVACDPDPARLALVQERFPDVETAGSVEHVVQRPDVDAVVVATPAATHAQVALMAMEAGRDVLVEKPMAATVEDARRMDEYARDHDRVLMVGHVFEFHPAFLKLQELAVSGALGKILYISTTRLNFGRVRTEENALWSFAPHDVALLLRLLGGMPNEVICHGASYLSQEVADVTVMTLRFPTGVWAHILVSWLHPYKERRFVVVGDKQMAVFDDGAPWDEKLVLYQHEINWKEGRVPVTTPGEGTSVDLEPVEPLVEECKHFLRCVEDRSEPLTDAGSGVRVLRVLQAGDVSMRTEGSRILLGPDGDVQVPSIHSTAIVHPKAEIGPGTRIWHHAHVMEGARIGSGCNLGKNVFVGRNVEIGNGVKIQNNVSVYEGVTLEDDVFCGPSMVFTNVINPRSEIDRRDEFLPTYVERGATLGANSTIVCGVRIGSYAFVGAGAVVTKDVPAFALALGVPARLSGWVCRCGVRLKGDETFTCEACGRRYRLDEEKLTLQEEL